jgi:hypothetical protein
MPQYTGTARNGRLVRDLMVLSGAITRGYHRIWPPAVLLLLNTVHIPILLYSSQSKLLEAKKYIQTVMEYPESVSLEVRLGRIQKLSPLLKHTLNGIKLLKQSTFTQTRLGMDHTVCRAGVLYAQEGPILGELNAIS